MRARPVLSHYTAREHEPWETQCSLGKRVARYREELAGSCSPQPATLRSYKQNLYLLRVLYPDNTDRSIAAV